MHVFGGAISPWRGPLLVLLWPGRVLARNELWFQSRGSEVVHFSPTGCPRTDRSPGRTGRPSRSCKVRRQFRPASVGSPRGSGSAVLRVPSESLGVRPVPRPASKAIRLGLYTCILYLCIYAYIYIYIYGFLVCRYARSLRLAARQNTPAFDGAFYRPNGTSYQLLSLIHI